MQATISFQKRKKKTQYMKLKQGGRDFPEHTQYLNGFPERLGKRCRAERNHTTGEPLSMLSETQSLLLSKGIMLIDRATEGFWGLLCGEAQPDHSQNSVTKRYRELRDRGLQTRPGY